MAQQGTCTVVVVGAGIVGVCIAYELSKRGIDTLLIDKDEPGNGCSFGNSGAISPSSVAPLAMPGVLASVPGMLGQPDSPLFLPWQYLPHALPWLARFVWSSRRSAVERSATRLAQIHEHAVSRHEALANEAGVPELLIKRGHLHLYPNERALKNDQAAWDLRERHGVAYARIQRLEILELEPHAPEGYQAGVYVENQATVRNPYRYVQAIFHKFTSNGGRFSQANVRAIKANAGDGWSIATDTNTLKAENVVIAAGAWSGRLLRPLGINLPLETQRGYHIQFKGGTAPVSRTVVLTDSKVFCTPMEMGLRVGGTVEFAGLAAKANSLRSDVLARIAKKAFPELNERPFDAWMGHRPCMPDSVPIIGPCAKRPGLWLAVGHGHLGLTDSVGTAVLIAESMEKTLGKVTSL